MAQVVAARLVRALVRLGWTVDRQSGSHVVLIMPGRNPLTVPMNSEGRYRALNSEAGGHQ